MSTQRLRNYLDNHRHYDLRPGADYRDIQDADLIVRPPRINERGNTVTIGSGGGGRYQFDFKLCSSEDGWRQFDTNQDAEYFGVWVHMEERLMFTYCEGDLSLVECLTPDSFRAELADAERFYGAPPPFAVVLDLEAKTETHVYDKRPSPEEVV